MNMNSPQYMPHSWSYPVFNPALSTARVSPISVTPSLLFSASPISLVNEKDKRQSTFSFSSPVSSNTSTQHASFGYGSLRTWRQYDPSPIKETSSSPISLQSTKFNFPTKEAFAFLNLAEIDDVYVDRARSFLGRHIKSSLLRWAACYLDSIWWAHPSPARLTYLRCGATSSRFDYVVSRIREWLGVLGLGPEQLDFATALLSFHKLVDMIGHSVCSHAHSTAFKAFPELTPSLYRMYVYACVRIGASWSWRVPPCPTRAPSAPLRSWSCSVASSTRAPWPLVGARCPSLTRRETVSTSSPSMNHWRHSSGCVCLWVPMTNLVSITAMRWPRTSWADYGSWQLLAHLGTWYGAFNRIVCAMCVFCYSGMFLTWAERFPWYVCLCAGVQRGQIGTERTVARAVRSL